MPTKNDSHWKVKGESWLIAQPRSRRPFDKPHRYLPYNPQYEIKVCSLCTRTALYVVKGAAFCKVHREDAKLAAKRLSAETGNARFLNPNRSVSDEFASAMRMAEHWEVKRLYGRCKAIYANSTIR